MSGYIFFDLETTGLVPAFNVPVQAAFIRTDDDLVVQDEIVLHGRVPDHIIPSPDAMLVTGLMPSALAQAPLNQLELAAAIARLLAQWAPATIIGFNTLKFDEEVLRHLFHQTLHPPYATSGVGFRRADVLPMLRTLVQLAPWSILIPEVNGKPVFRLGEVCRLNGIALGEDDAHDALNDVRATIALFGLMRARAPDLVAAMMRNAHKSGAISQLCAGGILGLADFGRIVPVTALMGTPDNATSWAVADLSIDPSTYLDLPPEDLIALMSAKGERPIRTVKANAQPMLLPWSAEVSSAATCQNQPETVYNDRLRSIHRHDGFWRNLSDALSRRFADRKPSPWPEARLYDGFLSRDDARRVERWHELDWSQRHGFAEAQISDDRARAFSKRLVFLEAPETLSPAQWQDGRDWLRQRLITSDDVPWLTLPAALARCAALRNEAGSPERAAQIEAISLWLEERLSEIVR